VRVLGINAVSYDPAAAGIAAEELDAVAYSNDPSLVAEPGDGSLTAGGWEGLRTLYARRPSRLLTAADRFPRGRDRVLEDVCR
jgi:carbamoyltransferase